MREGLFHLDEEKEPPGFDPDRPVHLKLRLRSGFMARWGKDPDRYAAEWQTPNSSLRHTEAWLAMEMLQ